MGFWDGVKEFFVGKEAEKYKADTNASSMGGAYGSTGNLQGLATRAAPTSTAANAGPASTTTAASLDQSRYDQSRNQQFQLGDLLGGASRGEGPSGAGLAAQAQRDSALSQAAALQAGRRGRSAVAGARMGTLAAQMGNQQASQTEAIGRANEMATARGQYAGLLGNLAGQDIGIAGQNAGFNQQTGMFNAGQRQQSNQFNAGLQQQTNLANQQANLQQQGINLGANNALQNQAQAEMAARMQQDQMRYGNLDPGSQGLLSPSNVATAAGAAMMLSDVNSKVGIRPATGRAKAGDWGSALGSMLSGIALSRAMERKEMATENRKSNEAARQKGLQDKGGLTSMYRQVKAQTQDPNNPVHGQDPDKLMSDWRGLGVTPTVSDEKSKREARDMLGKLTPYSYEYKDDAGQAPGRHVGVMAQDLERSERGREMVGRDEATGYKNVDYLKGLPTMMAGLADVSERIKRLEKKR